MVNKDSFITIQSFMRNELGLKDNELLVYAIIYGFSQDGKSKFEGSASYICEWTGLSRSTVFRILNNLVKKKLVIKEQKRINKVLYCNYTTTYQGGIVKMTIPDVKMTPGGIVKMTPHNIDIDNIKKIVFSVFETNQEEWLKVVNKWLAYKKEEFKFAYKGTTSLKTFLYKLKTYSNNDITTGKEIIAESISNGWQGIFKLQNKQKEKKRDSKYEYIPN